MNEDRILNQPLPTPDYEVFHVFERFGTFRPRVLNYKIRYFWYTGKPKKILLNFILN